MDAAAVEDALRAHFATGPPRAAAVWLFGSVARGTARPDSDVDVAVLLGRRPEKTLDAQPFDLQAELSRVLGREVDVVVLDDAPPDLAHRVLRDGRLVFEADPSARIAFQVRSRNEYFDLLPVLREYRRARRTA
jgi:predicted nucleotidyltransferase